MVGSTRGCPKGYDYASGTGSQQPPPPPPDFAEVLAAQTELLRQLVQGQQQQRGGHNVHQPQGASYSDFLMRTLGFVLSNPSFHCFCYHVLRQIRLAMPRNNFAVQSVSGGIIIMACSLLIMLLLERNSGMPSEALIFLRVLWRGN